jgi:hypothetical protein
MIEPRQARWLRRSAHVPSPPSQKTGPSLAVACSHQLLLVCVSLLPLLLPITFGDESDWRGGPIK